MGNLADLEERDKDGNLTDWALACDALHNNGCDCGEDEPGTCLACLCEAAMMAERARAEQAEAEVARLTEELANQRECARANAEHHANLANHQARESARLRARVEEQDRRLALIDAWTLEYGKALCPRGPDTYGEGMRDAKAQVRSMLARALARPEEEPGPAAMTVTVAGPAPAITCEHGRADPALCPHCMGMHSEAPHEPPPRVEERAPGCTTCAAYLPDSEPVKCRTIGGEPCDHYRPAPDACTCLDTACRGLKHGSTCDYYLSAPHEPSPPVDVHAHESFRAQESAVPGAGVAEMIAVYGTGPRPATVTTNATAPGVRVCGRPRDEHVSREVLICPAYADRPAPDACTCRHPRSAHCAAGCCDTYGCACRSYQENKP